jgi:hypothetical protein
VDTDVAELMTAIGAGTRRCSRTRTGSWTRCTWPRQVRLPLGLTSSRSRSLRTSAATSGR